MYYSNSIRRLPRLICTLAAAVALALGAAPRAEAYTTVNLLTDPGFEANPLLTNWLDIFIFPYTQNNWGAEVGAIVTGPSNGVTPINNRMLRMDDDGASYTQGWQKVDVSAWSSDINAGNVTVNVSALYNVPADVAAALAATNVNFYNSSHGGVAPFSVSGVATLDNNPNTWQPVSASSVVPAGTEFLLIQSAFLNSSMVNSAGVSRPGFVDEASLTLTVVPEPSSLALGAVALVGICWTRRRWKR